MRDGRVAGARAAGVRPLTDRAARLTAAAPEPLRRDRGGVVSQAKLIRRGLKRQLSESAHPAADRASLLAHASIAADSVPTLPEVYKHATYKRHRPGGETLTYEDLEAYAKANMRTPECRDVQLWFIDPSVSP